MILLLESLETQDNFWEPMFRNRMEPSVMKLGQEIYAIDASVL